VKVEVWSDVVCPWCYVGKRRLESAVAQFGEPVEVEFKSFELDPSAPRVREGSNAERLRVKYGWSEDELEAMQTRIKGIGAGEGIDLRVEDTRSGNSFDAHRLLHLAKERGLQPELKERLMRAYFTEAEPIGEPDVLARLAVEVGLDADEVADVLASDRYADAVWADEQLAAQLGINGVPFFVVGGRYAISGAQPAELILQALETASREEAA
jgi:predicted DsbA family dithiol-disulfide isomerase